MNNNCQNHTVVQLRTLPAYVNIPRGFRYNNKPKSRLSKSELCTVLNIHGSGTLCSQILSQIRRHVSYTQLPRGTNIGGRTRSRARKRPLCRYLDTPVVLFLRLHPDHDTHHVLSHMPTLEEHFNQVCQDRYVVRTVTFRTTAELLTVLDSMNTATLAHLVIITHGSQYSFQTGAHESLRINTPSFDQYSAILRRVMLVRAEILLVACQNGNFDGCEQFGNRSHSTVNITNASVVNFANRLAQQSGHVVYGTPGNQRADEILTRRHVEHVPQHPVCSDTNPQPLYIQYASAYQVMFRFLPVGL